MCLVILWGALQISIAAPEGSIRLAVISDSAQLAPAADLLTAELSQQPALQVLERNEIVRIYREQNLPVENRDFIKLGKLLSADGLVFLELMKEGTNQFLTAQLVSANAGIVLDDSRIPWPPKDTMEWAAFTARHFRPLYPKLGVQAKDALPMSIVALRATLRTKEEQELERQLTLMLIARLTQEPELFVLERRRMGSLIGEQELRAQDSQFWAGSYLVEGTLDRDGYSAELATVHLRLRPPQGQTVELQVASRRSDPRQLVEQLATSILKSLKRTTVASAWDPVAEANQYLEESGWQYKWGLFDEARAAADVAWALGKRDLGSALARTKAAVAIAIPDTGGYSSSVFQDSTPGQIAAEREMRQPWPEGVYKRRDSNVVHIVRVAKLPRPAEIRPALEALELYSEVSEVLKESDLQPDSPWYPVGVQALVAASQVLQHFNMVPTAQAGVERELVELRSQARKTATWIASAQQRHGRLPVPKRASGSWEYGGRGQGETEFEACQADWGCFWQDTPEAAMELYRELFKGPARNYCALNLLPQRYVRSSFTRGRETNRPLLVAWNAADRRRLPELTDALTQEIEQLQVIPAKVEPPQLASRPLPATNTLVRANFPPASLESRKEFLRTNTVFDLFTFMHLFLTTSYDRAEALELEPLLAEYRSNMLSKAGANPFQMKSYFAPAEHRLKMVLGGQQTSGLGTNRPAVGAQPSLPATQPLPAAVPGQPLLIKRFVEIPQKLFELGEEKEGLANWGVVGHGYHQDRLWLDVRYTWTYLHYYETTAGWGSHWVKTNCAVVALLDPKAGAWELVPYPPVSAPSWETLPSRPGTTTSARGFETFDLKRGNCCVAFAGTLYLSEWNSLVRYDLTSRQSTRLPVPWQIPTELFVVRNQLLAANSEAVFQLSEEGKEFKLLASVRRRPALSILDSMDTFRGIRLFPGPGQSVRAALNESVYCWRDEAWTKVFPAAKLKRFEALDGIALFRMDLDPLNTGLWLMPEDKDELELCLVAPSGRMVAPWSIPQAQPKPQATWTSPSGGNLMETCAGTRGSNILVFAEHTSPPGSYSPVDNVRSYGNAPTAGPKMAEKDGINANLLYLERGRTNGLVLPLKFDLSQGNVYSQVMRYRFWAQSHYDLTWLVATPELLFIGQDLLRGVWVVPISELDAAIAREKVRTTAHR